MTTTTNYLTLDIKNLFEEHTIKEIEEIRKKIQHESDRKKIELRTLVGERYRDFILAADTIGKMKLTSNSVVSRMTDVQNKFQEMETKYVPQLETNETLQPAKWNSMDTLDTGSNNDRNNDTDGELVILVKILMDIPGYLWTSIENKDLVYATQLYLVALHVMYCASFAESDSKTDINKRYPIVLKQWDEIHEFKHVILEECDKTLHSLDVRSESAANALAALVLLKGMPCEELLERLISLRSRAIESAVLDEDGSGVKNKVKHCITILIQTIDLIYQCFVAERDNSSGLVLQYLMAVQGQEAYSLLRRLDSNEEPMAAFLKSVIKEFKAFDICGLETNFPRSELRESVQAWLKWVGEFCNWEVTNLFYFVTSIKGLYYVREEAMSIRLPENWYTIWEELDLPPTTFWLEYFQPVITKKAKDIIDEQWAENLNRLKVEIKELLGKVSHDKCEFPENDLRWFIWRDSPSDIPQKLAKSNIPGAYGNMIGLDNKRSLLMKAKGYSPNILALCESFDDSLGSVLADLEQYLYETERATSIKENILSTGLFLISDAFADRAVLQEHLQDISRQKIEDLVCFIREECVNKTPEFGQMDVNAIVMARFLLALTTLCFNLNKCFTLTRVSGLTITNVKWQSICSRLKEESAAIWFIWAEQYKARIKEHRDKYVAKKPLDGFRIHLIISEWEKVTIEEDSGDGNRIKSEILVPYQPSIHLHNFLTAVTKDLNRIIPHTLPKRVLHDIVERVVSELLHYYSSISESSSLSQKQAFQVLFDIKYSTLLMVPRENKTLTDMSNKACDGILAKIDPFDYDVFDPFIRSNVKKSVQRSLLIFGNLVPHLEQLHSVLGGRAEYSSGGENVTKSDPPAMLALCSGAPWFPPLTVTNPARTLPMIPITVTDKTQRKKGTKETGRHETGSTSTIKSGAAAFFGAMGSDWFGGS